MSDKMQRNHNFVPHRQDKLVDKVVRRIEEEPSDEELLPEAMMYIETGDREMNEIFNLSAEELLKKDVLLVK